MSVLCFCDCMSLASFRTALTQSSNMCNEPVSGLLSTLIHDFRTPENKSREHHIITQGVQNTTFTAANKKKVEIRI